MVKRRKQSNLNRRSHCQKCEHKFKKNEIRYKIGYSTLKQIVCVKCREEVYGKE